MPTNSPKRSSRKKPDAASPAATGPGDEDFMRVALDLAQKGYGLTSPNPMVGALLVRNGKIIGRGWHHKAGEPHAEIEALREARSRRRSPKGATLYVTLEPCSTEGRTPPCTDAILKAGLKRVVVGAVDANPAHAGRGLALLREGALEVTEKVLETEATRLNEAFNHWIVHQTPFVTVKAALTLDGKIATVAGQSKWITGEASRARSMEMRQGADAILVGINTVLADNPSLTVRTLNRDGSPPEPVTLTRLRRIILDTQAQIPVHSRVLTDPYASLTTLVVGQSAAPQRLAVLKNRVQVLTAPLHQGRLDLRWLLQTLGRQEVTHLLVEGGGEVNSAFLLQGLAHRVVFIYAPKIIGGRLAPKAVGGQGAPSLKEAARLEDVEWERLGEDLLMTARVRRG
jgi:diaminohydroxyphosphoribosylaminopyrimidine deaminase / 5-amino-6-(5-phosphoribosylamino)uracil reductase